MAQDVSAPVGAAALSAARAFAAQAHADATRRAYRSDWADFVSFCRASGFAALPASPDTVAAYLASMATTHAVATIRRHLVAIGQAHKMAGHPSLAAHPVVRATMRGICRANRAAPHRAAALTTPEIRKLIGACGDDLTGLRDRALFLVGFAGALRRSELVGLDREHLYFDTSGVRLFIPQSKADQEGEGSYVGIPRGMRRHTCPVLALEDWLRASDCQYGPIFRKVDQWGHIEDRRLCPDAVRQILRRRAAAAGLLVPSGERLSPHGLRAGFVTEAVMAGAHDEQIMAHTRHADIRTMRGYVRRAKIIKESPAALLGL